MAVDISFSEEEFENFALALRMAMYQGFNFPKLPKNLDDKVKQISIDIGDQDSSEEILKKVFIGGQYKQHSYSYYDYANTKLKNLFKVRKTLPDEISKLYFDKNFKYNSKTIKGAAKFQLEAALVSSGFMNDELRTSIKKSAKKTVSGWKLAVSLIKLEPNLTKDISFMRDLVSSSKYSQSLAAVKLADKSILPYLINDVKTPYAKKELEKRLTEK